MAGPHPPVPLAGADADGEGAAAAERGHAAVRNQDWQVIDILGGSAVPPSSCQDTGCIIYNIKTRVTFQ